jgi:Domain of unknown function (DUF4157)
MSISRNIYKLIRFIKAPFNFAVALLSKAFLYAWNKMLNSDYRSLTKRERAIMAPYFKNINLKNIKLHENAKLVAPPEKDAMVSGNGIFWEGKLTICDKNDGPYHARLLAHELFHIVQQKRYSTGSVGFLADYMSTSGLFVLIEQEASNYVKTISNKFIVSEILENRRERLCKKKEIAQFDLDGNNYDEWMWILH